MTSESNFLDICSQKWQQRDGANVNPAAEPNCLNFCNPNVAKQWKYSTN